MSAPGPVSGPPGDAAGSASLRPADAQRFTGHVDALEQSVAEARDALQRLADTPLATGSGQDAAAMAAWYRELLTGDAAPAADALARELEGLREAVRAGTADWEDTDRAAADTLRAGEDDGGSGRSPTWTGPNG
jgi:hypothetical protein